MRSLARFFWSARRSTSRLLAKTGRAGTHVHGATKVFEVRAVVELDDGSHKSRQAEDSRRDAPLEKAGYRVQRLKHVPDMDVVRRAVLSAAPAPAISA
ncbi:MAG: DUF559 domain-containing protein [Comamonadaceae bacterium]|nr:MAG: DUF559 domain-containing protein [Comamonadaceae bacterium]